MKRLIALTAILFTISSSFSQTKEQDSLVMQLTFQKLDSTKVNTSIQLIESLYNSKDYQKALGYISQTEKLASSLQYHKAIAEIAYYKALIYSQRDDYFNAIDNYNKALSIFKQLNDDLGIAKVNNSVGVIEIKRGNYNKGLNYSLSAIQIFESNNLRSELSSAYNNLAEAYFNTNQFDKALDYNFKALSVREQLSDKSGIKMSTKNIAILYSMRKEHRRAIEYFEKLLNYLEPNKDQEIRAEILPRIGDEYLQFNDYTKATTYLLEGLRLNRNSKNKTGTLKSLNSIAKLNLKQNKLRLAEIQLNEAYGISKEINNDVELLKNYKLRIAIDSIKGNYRNAFNWQREYHKLKNTLDKRNTTPIIIEEPIEDTSVEKITEELPKYNISQTDDKAYNQLKLITYSLAAGLLVLLIVLLGIVINNRRNKKYSNILEEENKEFKIQNTSILEQTKHLEEMNQVKDKLFSIVSHDLKDSITGIKAFLDLLKEDNISQDEFNELIPELSDNADNATALLLNLLNWSKSQMQNLEPKPELFNIQEIFNEKMSLIEKKVEQKRIILLDESIKDFVYADRSMVEIVIQNLLANAIKFSKIGDVITISNRDRSGNVLICIEDTGVGISEENQAKIFKGSGFTTRGTNAEKGTGLGLSICKELVELNYGKIWVESEQNLGSKFFVELPKAKPIS